MIQSIRPQVNMIVVKLREVEDVSAGGILIPDVAKETAKEGVVLSVGPMSSIEEGAEVCFSSYAGQALDGDHLIMRDREVLCEIIE